MEESYAGWIGAGDIERVKGRADIVELAASHLGLPVTREGARAFKVPCPYPDHSDGVADGGSCLLKPDRSNSFYCFGCRRGGSVFTFYCLARGMDPARPEDWRRAVVELHDLFGMGLGLESAGPGTGCNIREVLADRLASLPCAEPLVSVEDGEYWTVGGPGVLYCLTAEERRCFYNIRAFDAVYPLTLTYVPALRLMTLNERGGGVCGLFIGRRRDLDFVRQHGSSIRMAGSALSGKPVADDAPRFFLVRFVVENPLDYLAIIGAGRPAVWGVWGACRPSLPVLADGFHCWVALHFGECPTSLRRFRVSLADDQLWLPREYYAAGLASLIWLSAERLDRFLRVVQFGNRPVPFLSPTSPLTCSGIP